ncbi:hybrid sensor histidine kinase/response regulator [Paraliomyxa miuraensis]|uniref:hybrid sensor histidine kinase/response regulator n=1 Tax=Paraliomyxa miuraensis TaxID=376150 RepID=UPI00224D714C|nr:ATP-binding protein [Paraliomyxa miuraensis]MCX4246874.1 ATP-binding protein [Paraliomyxa miuraensis]
MVEDNEGDVDLIREVLKARARITWCATVRAARETLEHQDFELILLDHGLPDGNGLTLLAELVKARPTRPVIMLTGREDRTLALSVLEMGARNYLVKSEILEHLWPAVCRVLGGDPEEPSVPGTRFVDTAEAFYPLLLETIGEGCLVFDEDGIVTFANRAARTFVERPDSLLGAPVLELLTPETCEPLARALEQARGSTSSVGSHFNARIRSRGAPLPVRISMHTLHRGGGNGGFENGILVLTDMTEQVRAQELRNDVVRAMLHDLRSPLNAIYGSLSMLEILDLCTETQEAQEFISLISIGAQQLLALVDQNLDIERFEAGDLPLSCTEADLAEELRLAIRAQKAITTDKALAIVCDIKTADSVAWCDAKLIGRVLQNLLGNAIRYSRTHERIVIALERIRGGSLSDAHVDGSSAEPGPEEVLRLSVSDEGPGVPPEIGERIFDKFIRGKDGGSGLGLTFCKMVVEAHGGRIWFEKNTPRGTRFMVEIPVVRSA